MTKIKHSMYSATETAHDELKDHELDQVSGGLMKLDPAVPDSGGVSTSGGGGSVIGAVSNAASKIGTSVDSAANRIGSAIGSLFGKP